MSWPTNRTEFGPNRTPVLIGIAYQDEKTIVPLAVDETTGALLTTSTGGGESVTIAGPLGQMPMADSVSVAIASDQSNIPVAIESGNITGFATSANQTNGTQQTKLTNGTNIADVVAGDSGFNGVATASATKTYTWTTSTTGAQIIGPYNVEGYAWLEIVYSSVGSGLALTGAQWCPTSGGTFVTTSSWGTSSNNSSVTGIGATANVVYFSPIRGNYFQLNVSALTSGTFAGTITLRNTIPGYNTLANTQSGTWTVGSNSATGSAVPANAFSVGIQNSSGNLTVPTTTSAQVDSSAGGSSLASSTLIYNGSTYDRQRSATAQADSVTGTGIMASALWGYNGATFERVRVDLGDGSGATGLLVNNTLLYNGSTYDRVRSGGVQGMQGVSIQASPSGAYSYSNITSATTTTVKSGAGTFRALTVNTYVASATITIYDNTAGSGTKIATITLPSTITGDSPATLRYDIAFATGLTIVTSGATDLTVSYK